MYIVPLSSSCSQRGLFSGVYKGYIKPTRDSLIGVVAQHIIAYHTFIPKGSM